MLKHYVEFDTPGIFMPETETQEVTNRIPASLKKIPKWTYALQYFDLVEVDKDGEKLTGNAKNRSVRVVFGKVYTKSDLEKEGFSRKDPLWRNSENTDDKVIKCITDNWQPWDKNWIILSNYSELKTLTNSI
jgi:hypothetical protein